MNLFEKYAGYEYSILKLNTQQYIINDIYDILLGRGYSCSIMKEYVDETKDDTTDDTSTDTTNTCTCGNCTCKGTTIADSDVPIIKPCADCCNSDSLMPRGDWCQNCGSRCPYKPLPYVFPQLMRSYVGNNPDAGWIGNKTGYFSQYQLTCQKLISEGKMILQCNKNLSTSTTCDCKKCSISTTNNTTTNNTTEALEYILIFDISAAKKTLNDLKKLASYYGEFKAALVISDTDKKYITLPDCWYKDIGTINFQENILNVDDTKLVYVDDKKIDVICNASQFDLNKLKYYKEKAQNFYGAE